MNKGVLFISVVFMAFQARAENLRLEPDAVVRVAADHTSIIAGVTNSTGEDLFCDSITLHVTRIGRDYNDFAGQVHVHSPPLYIPQGQSIDLSGLGSKTALSGENVVGVSAASIDTKLCHPASFAEYCAYAPKNRDEGLTTDLLLRMVRRDCDDVESAVGTSLTLVKSSVRSVVPLGFLRKLRDLNIERNLIEDLSPLKKLTELRSLNIGYNPVTDLTPVLSLVSIRWVSARHTWISVIVDPIAQLHGRGVNIDLHGTPYARNKK